MNSARSKMNRVLSMWCVGLLGALALAAPAAAALSGAIYTTTSDGTTVNGNIYDSKKDVYLSGGPQNNNDPGIRPDGDYYFQVTDPSGSVLLSQDPIACRQVTVVNGRITGATGACPHSAGAFNPNNGVTPVQLCFTDSCIYPPNIEAYKNTPNPGGEYKAWLTPVDNWSLDGSKCSSNSTVTYGFCDADSKTDNFKVKEGLAAAAHVTVCKFEDVNNSGALDAGDVPISGWPIHATGVDSGGNTNQTVDTQTGKPDGCVSFAFTNFTYGVANGPVTFTEGTLGTDWIQTYPLPAGSGWNLTLKPGDDLVVDFGNFNINCVQGDPFCSDIGGLTASKDANAGNLFTWTIDKGANTLEIDTSADASFTYTVTLTHDGGTGWKVAGTITLSNSSFSDITAKVTDTIDHGGTCDVTGLQVTVGAGELVTVPYSCTFSNNPGSGTNTVTVADSKDYNGNSVPNPLPATAAYAFTASNIVGGSVEVSDPMDSLSPRTFSYTDASPIVYTYDHKYSGDTAGTCTNHENTAAFTAGATGSASKTVKVCVGADLTISKTATPSFTRTYNWKISKAVDKTKVEIAGGVATFNYTVKAEQTGFTDSDWKVTGNIHVTNPNNWESVTFNATDSLPPGGVCTVPGGTGVVLAAGASADLAYSCTFAAQPGYGTDLTNTGTATWNSAAYFTPNGSASGQAKFQFGAPTTTVNKTITVTDTFDGTTTTLGTLTATDAVPYTAATYTYAHTVAASAGNCTTHNNTAAITETGASASQTVTVCNTTTGALTMGFWQNKNGQGIITGGASTAGVCNSGTWLRQYAPFQDLSATATCTQVAAYVNNVIKAANASGAAMNAMLKGQMLATALDVYFGGGPGGNPINAGVVIGNVKIDLTQVNKPIGSGNYENASSSFGPANSLTVSQMLSYAASRSNSGGSVWYGQIKNGPNSQELAKDAFDAVNNQVAYIAP